MLLLLNACSSTTTADRQTEKMANEASSSNEEKNLTGTFSAEGKNYSGKVSVQKFPASGQYSVLCEDDIDPNNSKLIQFVFKDEASARAAGARTIAYDQGKDQTPGEVALSYDIRYASHEKRPGTLSVNKSGSDAELVFDGVEVETVTKEKLTVSGKIPF